MTTSDKDIIESYVKQKAAKPENKSKTLTMPHPPGKSPDRAMADIATGGIVNSASLLTEFSNYGDLSLTDCVESLTDRSKVVHAGTLEDAETMLVSQATALDSLFRFMALRSKMNMGEYMNAAVAYMKLALKAQGQCRATLETLGQLKNPAPYIQNNRAQYQQVNNGMPDSSRTRENQKSTNELLEDHSHEWVDARTPSATGSINKDLETMGTKHRAND